jgi:histidinol-phosphatase
VSRPLRLPRSLFHRAVAYHPTRMNTSPDLDEDLALAFRLADTARAISLSRFRGDFAQRTKADGSIVTEVDEAVEDELSRILARERPGDAIFGEERGRTSGTGDRRWIIDAIDGTRSFAEGGAHWRSLIALEIAARIALGVCDEPPLDRRYWGVRGRGAFRSDGGSAPMCLSVSHLSELKHARSFAPQEHWARTADARAMRAAFLSATIPSSATDHPALQVAFGGYDVALFFMAAPWDLAAPAIVVEEAGGKFSDLEGVALFSNGRLHDATLRLLHAAKQR